MRKTITEKTELIVCDVCGYRQREGRALMEVCVVCGRDHCMSCRGIGLNPFGVSVCKDCIQDPKVEEVMEAALPRYRKERDMVLGRLKALNLKKDRRDREKEYEEEMRQEAERSHD